MGHGAMDINASDGRTGAATNAAGVQALGTGTGIVGGGRGVVGSDMQAMGAIKRKLNSRTGSNPLYASDLNEPKRFDVLETYE